MDEKFTNPKNPALVALGVALLKKMEKTPAEFNDWITELVEEERHCVRMVLIATKGLVKGINFYLKNIGAESLECFRKKNLLLHIFKICRYDMLNQFLDHFKENHGQIKGNLKAPLKCDCLLN